MTIKLNGSTAGSVALDAPASTTGNADIQFKLPVADGSAGQVLKTDGSGNLSWVSQPTAGITMAQQWRITSNYDLSASGGETVLSSNWEAVDSYSYGTIGSNLTNSSGTFSFPSTGIYLISVSSAMYSQWPDSASTDNWGIFMSILTSTGGSYERAAFTSTFIEAAASKYQSFYLSYIFDVTNTSTHKFRISQEVESATVTFMGDSNTTETGFSVIRLGDT
tara:strand:+ start:549 stop:1211 length:663 start_codon:yes stop_codon:yes gene_type:complete